MDAPIAVEVVELSDDEGSGGDHHASTSLDAGGEKLVWAVHRPGRRDGTKEKAPVTECRQRSRPKREAVESQLIGAGERAVKRLRSSNSEASAGRKSAPSSQNTPAAVARLSGKAVEMLKHSLGESGVATQIAHAIAAAFCAVHRSDASHTKRQLLALVTALRANEELRRAVLAAGPGCAADLVKQDTREWASAEVQQKRAQWIKEGLKEVTTPGGQIGECPECGGRAIIECGRAGSGRAARISKEYAHYSCIEETCGKSTHIQQG